jgi:hypothetical protein
MSTKGITSTSRGAFLTSDWIEFQKQLYASEEQIEKKFKKDWQNKRHQFQKDGNKVLYPYCHDDVVVQGTTPRSNIGPLPASLALYTGTAAKELIFQKDSAYLGDRFARSPRADAKLDQSVVNQLKGRLSKKNKLERLSKFSKSDHVKGCMHQTFNPINIPRRKEKIGRSGKRVGASSRASGISSRASYISSSLSNASTSSTCVNQQTNIAFQKIAERLDERVGLSLSQHRLFLSNGFRKHAVEGSLHISISDFKLFVVRSLGCGAGAINISHVTGPFRDDTAEGVERIHYGRMMNAYLKHVEAVKKQSEPEY